MKKIILAVIVIILFMSCGSPAAQKIIKEDNEKAGAQLEEILSQENMGYDICFSKRISSHRTTAILNIMLIDYDRKITTTFEYTNRSCGKSVSGVRTTEGVEKPGDKWKTGGLSKYADALREYIEKAQTNSAYMALKYLTA